MKNLVSKFLKDESGATAIEYGLIAALICIGLVAIVTTLGDNIQAGFQTLQNETANLGSGEGAS